MAMWVLIGMERIVTILFKTDVHLLLTLKVVLFSDLWKKDL